MLTLWGAAGAGIGFAWALTSLSRTDSQELKLLPFVLQVVVIAGILWYERIVRRLGVFSILTVSLAAYLVMFALVPLVDLIKGHPLTYHRAWWTTGWLALLGLVSVYAGYRVVFLFFGQSDSSGTFVWASRRAVYCAVALMAGALLGFLFLIASVGGPRAYVAIFRQRTLVLQQMVPLILGVSLAVPALLLVAGRWLARPTIRGGIATVFVWAPVTLVVVGTLGARFRVAGAIVALLAIFHFGYKRINPVLLVAIVFGMAAVFIAAAVQRNFVGSSQSSPEINVDNVYERYLATHDSVGEFREFLLTVESVPTRLDYQGGKTFLSLIPLTDYPTGGQLYSSNFFGDLYLSGTSISPSLPGELYMNFGPVGVVAGLLLFGVVVGAIESYFRSNRERIGSLLVYAYSLFPLAMELRGDFTSMTMYYLAGLVPLVAAIRFAEGRSASPTSAIAKDPNSALPLARSRGDARRRR